MAVRSLSRWSPRHKVIGPGSPSCLRPINPPNCAIQRTETAELRRELDEVRTETGLRNAVIRNAVVKSATSTASPVPVGGLQNALENREPQDQRAEDRKQDQNEDRKEDRKKGEHAASLEEEYQLLSGKVDDQYQTKVESASKYRVRLSGIVLMNLASN